MKSVYFVNIEFLGYSCKYQHSSVLLERDTVHTACPFDIMLPIYVSTYSVVEPVMAGFSQSKSGEKGYNKGEMPRTKS